ncbi:MAG: hypothetical protein U9R49_15920, partial [Bacteroidota bacterium]|nr:hypothetical protein [Bacteroidota bacterium]
GNILYIVITIVAVAIGLLGKKKKPAEGGKAEPGSEARPGFMENLERVLQMGQEQQEIRDLQDFEEDLPAEEAEPVPVVEESFNDMRSRPSIMDEYERIMNQNRDGELDHMLGGDVHISEPLEVIDFDESHGTDYFEIVKEFDAGTAVVYSAIINRLDI